MLLGEETVFLKNAGCENFMMLSHHNNKDRKVLHKYPFLFDNRDLLTYNF